MGMKINIDGLTNVYAKVIQVNVKNMVKMKLVPDDNGQEIPVATEDNPMDVVLEVFTDIDKTHSIKRKEYPLAYSSKADDKNPVNQAYAQVKPELIIVEDNV